MKILHVNFSDGHGGAAKAAYRLHQGLLNNGIDSKMIVIDKKSSDRNVIPYLTGRKKLFNYFKNKLARLILKLQKSENKILHSLNIFSSGLDKFINQSDADIVHLNWIGNEMVSLREVAMIKKPCVWTLHDSWVFCGAEHHPYVTSKRHVEGYTKANRSECDRGIDVDRYVWQQKKKYWKQASFNIVTPSKWLEQCATQSFLLRNKNIVQIYNGTDINIFRSNGKAAVRKKHNLPENKKLLLFGAVSATTDRNKGFHLLREAINKLLEEGADVEVMIFGSEDVSKKIDIQCKIYNWNNITDEKQLAELYSAADVFVLPSLIENLPTVLLEAMACGTPGVAFNVGGIKEIIDHKINGYLATPYRIDDLINGIRFFIESENTREFEKQATLKIKEMFTLNKSVDQYIELYKKLIKTGEC
ncbi:glycosyltransferase [Chitinophaga oryziterrae]|uniref:Glycosyltransferase n=1 Tax=Chitinophaga oryziterrae TaxID=1031224 RepID=A0A6N8JHV2_9BACT|nr:glycosyltransferase [Chitinophaga oryziterrae]MVT44061.1 glycosyltransferase [Chitinophaga oryziterrae]